MNAQQFYYQFKGSIIGPMTGVDLRESALVGNVKPVTLVANDPNGEWVAAIRIRGLFDERGKPLPHPPETKQTSNGSQQAPRVEKPAEIEVTASSGGSGQPKQFYYQVHGNVIGPVTGIELREAAFARRVVPTTLVANDPNGEWLLATFVRGLFDDDGAVTLDLVPIALHRAQARCRLVLHPAALPPAERVVGRFAVWEVSPDLVPATDRPLGSSRLDQQDLARLPEVQVVADSQVFPVWEAEQQVICLVCQAHHSPKALSNVSLKLLD